MKTTLTTILALCIASASAISQNAAEIIEKHTKEAAIALEAYLDKNPKAEDASEAIDYLIEAYDRMEAAERRLELLQVKYEALPKGKDLAPQEFVPLFQEIFKGQLEAGKKEAAAGILTKAKKDVEGHEQAAQLAKFIDKIGASINMPVVGETMVLKFTSIDGDEVDLAKMKGKVVLIDFWATWCVPCIRELPMVKQTYADYHDKGFEIVAVSLDQNEKKLRAFIKENEMPWVQAFDGKGWDNEIAGSFGITSIPATFLIGADGKVIARDLRGEALPAAVAKALE